MGPSLSSHCKVSKPLPFLSFLSKHTILGTELCACAAANAMGFCFGLEHLDVNKNKLKRLNSFGSLGEVDCRKKAHLHTSVNVVFPVIEKSVIEFPFPSLTGKIFIFLIAQV